MTSEEQDQIIGKVVREIADTKKLLACLEEKAEGLALHYGLLCNWLRGHFPTGVVLPEGISVADALTLIDRIKETKQKIERLEARRIELGV